MLDRVMGSKKTIWYLLSVVAVAVAIIAVALVCTARSEGNISEAKGIFGAVDVKAVKIDDSARHAGDLFAAKIEDVNDTAKVVKLFETMGLEEATGEYAVEISMDEAEGTRSLKLSVANAVQQSDKKVFGRNIKKYAQQMLVLIPQIDKVEWSYSVLASNGNKKNVTSSFDSKDFNEAFGKNPGSYGKSKNTVQNFLKEQTESKTKKTR